MAQATRILAFDWLRGIAVVVMIQTHALTLLRPELRTGPLWSRLLVLRWVALGLALLVFGLSPFAECVHGPLAALTNGSTGSVFPLMPWAGYVYLGASAGATAAAGDVRALARWIVGLLVLGIVL